MNHIAPLHEPLIREVPLSRLALAPENVRKTPADPVAEAEMKASIATHGLLENLVVRMDGPADAGTYAVVAGGRLTAMKALAEDGTIDADHPVPCLVATDPAMAGELSLAENIVRIAMHPADQVIAFTKLADAGLSVATIAARFGTAERLVEQRLLAQRRHDVAVDDAARRALRLRLAADRDMLLEIARREVGHRRAAGVLRRERQRHRVLGGLDARDDERGPLARLLGAEHRVPTDRDPPRLAPPVRSVRPARLGDVELAASRIDPNPEAGEFAVPEHGVALDGERRYRAVGDCPVLQHRLRPSLPLCGLGAFRREVGADAVAGPRDRGLLGVLNQMRIPGGGADLGVSEQFADHAQALAERERPRGVGVAYIMYRFRASAIRCRAVTIEDDQCQNDCIML